MTLDLFAPPGQLRTPYRQPALNELRVFRTKDADVDRVELIIRDLSGGINKVYDEAREAFVGRMAASTGDSAWPGHLTLPFKTTAASVLDPGSGEAICHTNIFDKLAIGVSNDLYIETSPSNPALSARTFTANGTIRNLSNVVSGGANQPEQLAVCCDTGAVEILSDLGSTPTSVGDMNAATVDCGGIVMSPLNNNSPGAQTLIIIANNNIYTLGSESAIGTAPTAVQAIPNGTWPLGLERLIGYPPRIFLYMPFEDQASGHGASNPVAMGKLMTIDLDGQTLMPFKTPLDRVFAAAIVDGAILGTEGVRVIRHTGEAPEDLGWTAEREANSDIRYRCVGFFNIPGSIYVLTTRQDIQTDASTTLVVERLVGQSWHQSAAAQAKNVGWADAGGLSGPIYFGGQYVARAPGAFPYSRQSSFIHYAPIGSGGGQTKDYYQFVPPSGTSPFLQWRKTTNDGVSQEFEGSSITRSPIYSFPTLAGGRLVLEETDGRGLRIAEGGSTASVKVEAGIQGASSFSYPTGNALARTFKGSDRISQYLERFGQNKEVCDQFQFQITMTQGSDSRMTPNGLPLIFRFLNFRNGKQPVTPIEFWGR